jgi:large subunit ribosomal protein L24
MPKHIRKGDMVLVTSGRDAWIKQRDASGRVTSKTRNTTAHKVLRVLPDQEKVVVQGINVRVQHVKPSQANPQGGTVEREMPIHISNVSPADANGKATRVRYETRDDGSKVRVAATTGDQIGPELKKAK